MVNYLSQIETSLDLYKQNLPFLLYIIGGLWGVHIINWMFRYRLNYLGILPRHVFGLSGVVLSPLLHNDFSHLAFNTVPLFALGGMVLLLGKIPFIQISIFIILVSGLATWVFGRRALHIGASSLIMGYWGFLLVHVVAKPGILTLILAVVTIYYFGGMFVHLVPGKKQESWEGHIFGFLAGILATLLNIGH